ncbi:hypothetical protein [Stenotrophomonas sp. SY1]|uniref:hypothetical protein n=1 Tax=Stenotrophomonas sp. SY1 TaxID=477235 RepID=UPI001E5AB400|nr:hypothetical protein [Stenotrophomonas sp. SY1]MCD9085941.1 hypothetical protein [Stenotrophomonas sp. SY1]
MRIQLFLCVALLSTSPLAQASAGTVHFSGRIVDPACTPRMSLTQGLQLEHCPASAKGATVAMVSTSDAGTVALYNGKFRANKHTLSARDSGTESLGFSEDFRPGSPLKGGYIVVVDYP